MAHVVKKIYQSGSPGFKRKLAEMTLTSVKRQIATSPNKAKARKAFRDNGYLT